MHEMISDNELYHWGIKGQKWGIRRYQNDDGTYTEAGKRRYGMNLDINDKSKRNIAKIRTGEAKRRLDVAKRNNSANYSRIAELQGRVRSAKANERKVRSIDKGEKLAAKGQTIIGNKTKSVMAYGAAYLASEGIRGFLNHRLSTLGSQGRYTPGHNYVAKQIYETGMLGAYALATLYSAKQAINNNNIRSYYNAKLTGSNTIKSVGSQEYADVIKRNKENK